MEDYSQSVSKRLHTFEEEFQRNLNKLNTHIEVRQLQL